MVEKRGNWQRLSSEIVHTNPHYSVRKDAVIKPDGSHGFYNVVQTRGAVIIVAIDNEQNAYLVGLHRYTNNRFSLELPAGGIDEGDDDPLIAAKRELEEEAGLTAKTWKQLGVIYPANGLLSEDNYVFLATDLKQSKNNLQTEEGILEVKKVPLQQAFAMIKSGEITDAQSIAPLAMVALELGLLGK